MWDAAADFMDCPYSYSRRASGPKRVLWAINRINTKVSPWPFQQCGMAGIFMCLPQAVSEFLSVTILQKPFPASSFLKQKNTHHSEAGTPYSASGHGINSSLPAGQVPRHSMHESNLGTVLFLVSPLVPQQSTALLPAPSDLKMRVP